MELFDNARDGPQYTEDDQPGSVGSAVLAIVAVIIAASWLLGA